MELNLFLLGTFVITVLTFLCIPGPVSLLVISNATKSFKTGVLTIIGTNVASLILILLSYVLVTGVIAFDTHYLTWLRLFGACYLCYLSWTIFKSTSIKKRADVTTEQHSSLINNKAGSRYFLQGLFTGVSNPKDILFFSSFFTAFTTVHTNFNLSFLILTLTWVSLDYAILLAYCFFVRKLPSDRILQVMYIFSAGLLLLFSFYIFVTSLKELFY